MNSTRNSKRDRGTGARKLNGKRAARSAGAGFGGWGAEELERRVLLSAAIAALGNPITTPTGGGPAQVVLADRNGDGKLDAVQVDETGGAVGISLNSGGRLTGEGWGARAGAPMGVVVADVMSYFDPSHTPDGYPDLVIADYGH